MEQATLQSTLIFEHSFWLQVLGDHGRIILHSLAPAEKAEINCAQKFIKVFEQLLALIQHDLSSKQLNELTQYAYEASKEIRCFKLDLIRQHLVENIKIALSPSFINHMVNEVEEYLEILDCVQSEQKTPDFHPVHHHLLWLSDAAGHAAALACDLDQIEFHLREKSLSFAQKFQQFYNKAVELNGYLRTGINHFPVLVRFNHQVEREILLFQTFLAKISEQVRDKKTLGTLQPLIPEHMLREECYYLTKLAAVSNIKPPKSNPPCPGLE